MAITAGSRSIVAASFTTVIAYFSALIAGILVLVWGIRYRGGLALNSNDNNHIFNVHPVVMVLGFIIVSGEGIMVHRTAERQVRKSMHMMVQLTGLVLGIIGVYAAFTYHEKSKIPNMYTLHSWLGIATFCLYCFQCLFGVFFFWVLKVSATARLKATPIHATAGLAVFLLTIGSAETGLVQKETLPGAETRLVNFIALFVLFFGTSVAYSAILPRLLTI